MYMCIYLFYIILYIIHIEGERERYIDVMTGIDRNRKEKWKTIQDSVMLVPDKHPLSMVGR
jgi:hypothetical protein